MRILTNGSSWIARGSFQPTPESRVEFPHPCPFFEICLKYWSLLVSMRKTIRGGGGWICYQYTKRCSEKFEGAPKTELTRKDETTSSEWRRETRLIAASVRKQDKQVCSWLMKSWCSAASTLYPNHRRHPLPALPYGGRCGNSRPGLLLVAWPASEVVVSCVFREELVQSVAWKLSVMVMLAGVDIVN
jgi:hypothetical protein